MKGRKSEVAVEETQSSIRAMAATVLDQKVNRVNDHQRNEERSIRRNHTERKIVAKSERTTMLGRTVKTEPQGEKEIVGDRRLHASSDLTDRNRIQGLFQKRPFQPARTKATAAPRSAWQRKDLQRPRGKL